LERLAKEPEQEQVEVFAGMALEEKPEKEQVEPKVLGLRAEPEEKLALEGIEKEPYQELERKLGLERLEKGPEQEQEVFAVALEDKPEQEQMEPEALRIPVEPEEKLVLEGIEKEPYQELERKLGLERLEKGPEQQLEVFAVALEDKPEQECLEQVLEELDVLGVRAEPEDKLAQEGMEKERLE
jgi:hypothetical protein